LDDAAQPVTRGDQAGRASSYEGIRKETVVINHYSDLAQASLGIFGGN
jgi:hypothetical protein